MVWCESFLLDAAADIDVNDDGGCVPVVLPGVIGDVMREL